VRATKRAQVSTRSPDSGGGWGAFGDVVTALTGIGTAVVLYRVLRAHGRAGAIGFVASRTLEAAMLFVSALSLLAVITVRQDATAATGHAALLATGHGLVGVHNWAFLFGPGLMPAVNALCFATVLYRSRLVPRIIPTIGLVGAPLLTVSFLATLFGAWSQTSSTAMVFALPIAAWEFTIGVSMIVRGFRSPDLGEAPTQVGAHGRAELAV
jgi:NADH:ubiquinone oxidoreductase subunit K